MVGQTISHYKIIEKLGEGGMGIVYKAHDLTLDRMVALKFLPRYLTSDPVERERFLHEARAAAALTHANIAVIYEIGEHDGEMFIAMEYVEGKTLKQVIQSETLSIPKILDIAIQACDGLSAAHDKGIVHRDIKSDNIMVTPRGHVKITDFGLAKLKGATKLTKTGSTLGTAAYMSPEQALGEEVDQRSDIFSLGIVLYEMITLHLPFRGEHAASIEYAIANEQPAPLARYNEKVSEEVQHIVSKALEKDKEDRYQHVDEMLVDLRRERKHLEYARLGYATSAAARIAPPPTAPEPPSTEGATTPHVPPPRQKRLTPLLAGIGVTALLGIAFLILRPLLLQEAVSSERRSIAVISFVNQTGDKAYDYLQDAIPNLLITNLEQSPYLQVTTWERLYDLRKQMGKTDGKVIDRDLGFELCKMDGIDAIVLGSFTKAGDMFATDVKVLDVRSKQLLKSSNAKGEGVGSILKNQIDDLSKEISRGIGLSEKKIDSTPLQIAERTTTSMEAYNYYIRGFEEYNKFYYDDARRFLEKAVSIDSTFALAYVYLAFTCQALSDQGAALVAFQRAGHYGEKGPEKEQMMIRAALAYNVDKDREKWETLMKDIVQRYPKEKWARYYLGAGYFFEHRTGEAIAEWQTALTLDSGFGPALNQLGYAYADIGEFGKAIDFFQRYAAANPGDANPYDSMAEIYFKMGKVDEAEAQYKEVLEMNPEFYQSYVSLAYVNFLKRDVEKGNANLDRFLVQAVSPGIAAEGYRFRAVCDYYSEGKLQQSLKALDRAEELFHKVQNETAVALTEALRAWIHFDRQDTAACRKSAMQFFNIEEKGIKYSTPQAELAFTLGLLCIGRGGTSKSRSYLQEMDKAMPDVAPSFMPLAQYHRDLLLAEILLAEDSLDEAIYAAEQARLPVVPNLSSTTIYWYNIPPVRDIAARAYLRKGDFDKAIASYQSILSTDTSGNDRRLPLPKYHYTLAKVYEQRGSRDKAIAEYRRFLSFWKDADTDLHEVKDARERVKTLAGNGNR
jgi:serine/threonine protein kinase/Tfp pilus assembly protein PilF